MSTKSGAYKPMDILVSFDTTGSMYSVLSQVRSNVASFVKEMFKEVEDLRMGVICHGDYCDKDHPYTIRVMDLTTNQDDLVKFIKETKSTYGGDSDECYELVLNVCNNEITWGKDREKIIIMIGDANPHGIYYPENDKHLDWQVEAKNLAEKNIKIFGIHAMANYRNGSKRFYESISHVSGGVYLTLDNFNEVSDIVLMTAISQQGEGMEERLNDYVTIIRDKGRMTKTIARNFDRLTGKTSTFTEELRKISRPGLVPVPSGRFQTMHVDSNVSIRDFINANGVDFKPGRGFYELTKHETVQQYKEIILQDRETGEMFNGDQVREYLHLQPQVEKGGVKESLSSRDIREFRVFVQSTSYNRKLIGGTILLYEVADFMEAADVKPVDTSIVEKAEEIKTKAKEKAKAKKSEVKKAKDSKVATKKPEVEVKEVVPVSTKDIEKKPVTKKSKKAEKVETPKVEVTEAVKEKKTKAKAEDKPKTKTKTKKPATKKVKTPKIDWSKVENSIVAGVTECTRAFTIMDKKPTRNDLAAFIKYYTSKEFEAEMEKFEVMLNTVRASNESLAVTGKSKDLMRYEDYAAFLINRVK